MSNHEFYGNVSHKNAENPVERVAEEVQINGWSKLENVVDLNEVNHMRNLIDKIYLIQESEFGREALLECHEADQARCLTRYDKYFIQLIKKPQFSAIVKLLLGDFYTLMLQNATISRPDSKNHQSSWHRDLPYQNFVSSEPLAINVLLVIDEFNNESGGTQLLPYSHKLGELPSKAYIDKHKLSLIADPGDAIVFDSMLYHRAGINCSSSIRRAINNQFSKPFIKPQYALHEVVPAEYIDNDDDRRLLGMTSTIARDEREWRLKRLSK